MLFLDGVYVGEASSSARFHRVKAATCAELTQLAHTIAHRLARYLERQGVLERDAEHSHEDTIHFFSSACLCSRLYADCTACRPERAY